MTARTIVRLIVPAALVFVATLRGFAQQPVVLRPPSFDVSVPAFTDRDLATFESTLDGVLAAPLNRSAVPGMNDAAFWDVARGLQTGRLSAAQEARVLQHLGDAGRAHPEDIGEIDELRHMVSALTVGKIAPEIMGRDLDGNELRLSDYRGKVVVLVFSGEWCGICRSQYPYERLLLELYRNWPFAIVGVNSDIDRDAAKQALAGHGLTYRAWWDGYLADNTAGPIATAWNVAGWPTVYVLDGTGTIRFVDVRDEDLLKAVRQLLTEPTERAAPTRSRR